MTPPPLSGLRGGGSAHQGDKNEIIDPFFKIFYSNLYSDWGRQDNTENCFNKKKGFQGILNIFSILSEKIDFFSGRGVDPPPLIGDMYPNKKCTPSLTYQSVHLLSAIEMS